MAKRAQEPGSAKNPKPTIKAIFVKSHIAALTAARGTAGVAQLRRRFGKPIDWKNGADIPVRDEVKIIEISLDLMSRRRWSGRQRQFEAGRLHFRNFTTTPLAKIIFSVFRHRPRAVLLQARNIAGHVFRGVHFDSRAIGPAAVEISMSNNDYPIEHFRGLFYEWIIYSGFRPTVTATAGPNGSYIYTISWRRHD